MRIGTPDGMLARKRFVIHVGVYCARVVVVTDGNTKRLRPEFPDEVVAEYAEWIKDKSFDAFAVCDPEPSPVVFGAVFNLDRTSYGLVSHEMDHVTNHILRGAMVETDYRNDEAHTYLLGYLVDQFFNRLFVKSKDA